MLPAGQGYLLEEVLREMIGSVVLLLLMTTDISTPPAMNSPGPVTSHSLAPQSTNSITGTVYSDTRRPLENMRVELLDEVDGLVASTYTNAVGQYSFYRLSSGTFQVRVLTGGSDYQSKTERVNIMGSLMGGRGTTSEQVDFVLSPKKERRKSGSVSHGAGSIYVQEVPDNARSAYETAVRELESDKSKEKALADLQRAIDLFPEYYAALDLLGQEYVKRANYQAALPLLTKAVSVNSRSSSTWYSLGYTQYRLRNLPAATESLTKAASLNADSSNIRLLLGTVERMQQHWGNAETQLKQARTLSKTPSAEVHWQLALLYNQTNRYAEAADHLELFLKAQPDSRDAEKIRKLIAELRQKK